MPVSKMLDEDKRGVETDRVTAGTELDDLEEIIRARMTAASQPLTITVKLTFFAMVVTVLKERSFLTQEPATDEAIRDAVAAMLSAAYKAGVTATPPEPIA